MNLNSSIELFNEREDLVIYIINEWSNPVVNLFTGNACKKAKTIEYFECIGIKVVNSAKL